MTTVPPTAAAKVRRAEFDDRSKGEVRYIIDLAITQTNLNDFWDIVAKHDRQAK